MRSPLQEAPQSRKLNRQAFQKGVQADKELLTTMSISPISKDQIKLSSVPTLDE